MEICFGMIGMRPKDFWNSSPREIYAAIAGFMEFNGGNQKPQHLTRSELNKLMELYPD